MPSEEKKLSDVIENLSEITNTKIWLIQNGKLVQQHRGKFASFFSGSCYMIIKTTKSNGRLHRDIYVWVGSEVGKEEGNEVLEGVYQTVRHLDCAVVYRQSEKHEARQFLDIFSCGVRYFNGTPDTYKHFSSGDYVKRLFHIKGKRNVHVTEVPLSYTSMNKGDSFVLDDEWTIYCWNGEDSNKAERIKAIEVAQVIRDDLCFGRAQIVIADNGANSKEEKMFFKALGSFGEVQCAESGGDDDCYDKENIVKMTIQRTTRKLYRLEEGDLVVDQMTYTQLRKDQLDTNTCYLLDTGDKSLYAWVGLKYFKDDIIDIVVHFIGDEEYENISVTVMKEGREIASFKQFFDEWPERNHPHKALNIFDETDSNAEFDDIKFDDNEEMIDQALGPIRIWQVDGINKFLWPTTWYGYFFDNECYIVEYFSEEMDQEIIYIWQGKNSLESEQTSALELVNQMDKDLDYEATIVKIVQGREVEHFLRLFKGQMVVRMDEDGEEKRDKFFEIKGNDKNNMNVTQVPMNSGLLKSDGVFLLHQNGDSYLWQGLNVIDRRIQALTEEIADRMALDGDLVIISETQELPVFWEALGGKKERENLEQNEEGKSKEDILSQRIQLFHCSDASGKMKIEEISPFDQKDLHGDDVMILDTQLEIFVWFGNGANEHEMNTGLDTAQDFIKISGRNPNTVVNIIKQGWEPPTFTAHFDEWDYAMAIETISYEQLKKQIREENQKAKAMDRRTTKKTNQVGERMLKRTHYKGILKTPTKNKQ